MIPVIPILLCYFIERHWTDSVFVRTLSCLAQNLRHIDTAMTSCDKDHEHESPVDFGLPHAAASAYFPTLSMTHQLGLPNASTCCGDIM